MATVARHLRVATWNIHEGIPVNGQSFDKKTQKELVDLVSREQIDVLCLQEVDFDHFKHSRILDVVSSKTHLKFFTESVLSESSFFPSECAGVAIASRFPLKNSREWGLKNPGLTGELNGHNIKTFDKGLVSAVVSTSDMSFRMISLHSFPFHLFGRYADERNFRCIWEDLASEISKLANYPLIVCGDFNATQRHLILELTEVPLTRVIGDVPTYKDMSYDDILVSSPFHAQSSWTIENFSDHRLCLADLRLEVGYDNEKESARAGTVTGR